MGHNGDRLICKIDQNIEEKLLNGALPKSFRFVNKYDIGSVPSVKRNGTLYCLVICLSENPVKP